MCAKMRSCTAADASHSTVRHADALQAMVERYLEVDVVAVTPMGDPVRFRAHGWQARILQHEVDHLKVCPQYFSYYLVAVVPWK